MSILRQIARAQDFENAGVAVNLDPWREAFLTSGTDSGRIVTVENAMMVAAVWSAIRILSDAVGSLPLISYRRINGGRARAEDFRSWRLLHDEPNPEMSASTVWALLEAHLNSWGNGYLGKTYRGTAVTELWPIRPDRVDVSREKGQKVFRIRDEKGVFIEKTFTAKEILHFQGLTLDGLTGLSPIACARESIGAALAMDQYANRFFRDGALPRIVLRHKGKLSAQGKKTLRQQWEQRYRGSNKANRVAVLEEDVQVQTLSLPQKDLEFVEQRKHSIQEISRWFRVPVTMLEGDKGGSMQYSTVEGDAISFVTHSVRPWLVRIEQALNNDRELFPPGNRIFCEFLVDGIMRADTLARYQAYAIAANPLTGWMKPREIRERENLPPDSSFDVPTRSPADQAPDPRVPAERDAPIGSGV